MTNQGKLITTRIVFQVLFFIVLIPLLPLLISRRWGWWEAWVFALIYIGGFAASRTLVARRHHDLIKERSRFMQHEDAKPWDKILAPLVGIGSGLIPLAAGMDALSDRAPVFSLTVKISALVVILAGYILGSYALIENRFFSGMVRIQADRGHHVVSGGPYRWIRHPGYSGALLSFLAMPVFLDSLWAFLPAVFLVIILVVRTSLEDRVLQDELENYRDYARLVWYRLFPGIW